MTWIDMRWPHVSKYREWTDEAFQHHCVVGCSTADVNSLADRLLQCSLVASHPHIAVDVVACSLDVLPRQACNREGRCHPRIPWVSNVLTSLGRDSIMGPALLRRACKVLSWLLSETNADDMYKSVHAAACSITVMEPMQV